MRSFVVNIARRGGWIEREQAFANAYSFLAVIACRSHFFAYVCVFGVIDVCLSGLSACVSSARALLAQRVGGLDVACLRNRSMPPERLRNEVGN